MAPLFGSDGLRGTVQDIANQRAGNMGSRSSDKPAGSERGDKEPLTEATFHEWRGDSLIADDWQTLGIYVVPPQEGRTWGFGDVDYPDFVGRFWGDIAESDGSSINNVLLRTSWQNARGKARDNDKTFHSASIRQNESRRDAWEKFQEADMPMVKENSELRLEAKYLGDAGTEPTIDQGETQLIIDTTVFDES